MKSEYGKWIHAAFTGASFAYFLTVFDKTELVLSSSYLVFSTIMFSSALILNSIWSVAYYGFEDDICNLVNKHKVLRRFSNLSQWSFIFASIALVLYVLEPVVESFL